MRRRTLIAPASPDRPLPFDGTSDEARLDWIYPGWRRASRRQLRRWLVNELHDVQMIEDSASAVYCHITGGLISKATTVASAVIAEADRYVDQLVAEEVASER